MPYKSLAAPRCDGWWDCLSSGEQVAIIIGSGLCLTMILVALILTMRGKKD